MHQNGLIVPSNYHFYLIFFYESSSHHQIVNNYWFKVKSSTIMLDVVAQKFFSQSYPLKRGYFMVEKLTQINNNDEFTELYFLNDTMMSVWLKHIKLKHDT